jgi:hypothetical protein
MHGYIVIDKGFSLVNIHLLNDKEYSNYCQFYDFSGNGLGMQQGECFIIETNYLEEVINKVNNDGGWYKVVSPVLTNITGMNDLYFNLNSEGNNYDSDKKYNNNHNIYNRRYGEFVDTLYNINIFDPNKPRYIVSDNNEFIPIELNNIIQKTTFTIKQEILVKSDYNGFIGYNDGEKYISTNLFRIIYISENNENKNKKNILSNIFKEKGIKLNIFNNYDNIDFNSLFNLSPIRYNDDKFYLIEKYSLIFFYIIICYELEFLVNDIESQFDTKYKKIEEYLLLFDINIHNNTEKLLENTDTKHKLIKYLMQKKIENDNFFNDEKIKEYKDAENYIIENFSEYLELLNSIL